MHGEPGHLLARDGEAEEDGQRPEEQELGKALHLEGQYSADRDQEGGLDVVLTDEPGVTGRQAEDRHHEQGRAGQKLLLQLPAKGVEESAAQGKDQRQELVDRQEHEVVVVGLVAPPHELLAQPVVHRTPDAGPEAAHVGEEAGEEEYVHSVEESRADEPHAPVPEQSEVGAADDEHQHRDPHQVPFRHVALIFDEG